MSKDNGGPAFPELNTEASYRESGMTLRDYFAAKARAACIGNTRGNFGVSYEVNNKNLAMASYAIAEAMLAERAQ